MLFSSDDYRSQGASMSTPYKLYGIPASLYTAKARSYLRKQKIDFVEYAVSDPHYQKNIIPQLGRMIMPVLEAPNGEIIQDSADIIRYLENVHASLSPSLPKTPLLQAVAHLFELYGGEGLLRPAMHYRWSFDDVNLHYLHSEFACLAPPGTDDASYQQIFDFGSGLMRKAALSFGVNENSAPLIESSYREFLDLFSAHLRQHPYLLGAKPTLGDYALMAPLYAHLYRDPKPGQLMRQHAPLVARWVERMNSPENNWADHCADQAEFEVDNELPDTLKSLMHYIAVDFLPEISAHIQFANNWLAERPDLKSGSNGCDNPSQRFIGNAEFAWRGIKLRTAVLPYRFYLLQNLQDHFDSAPQTDKALIQNAFKACGLADLLTLRVTRRVERHNHLEVWGNPLH